MEMTCESFPHESPIPEACAFQRMDPDEHATFAGNRNPGLRWRDVPEGTKSYVLVCIDPDAPTVPDDVNREGRTVSRDLPRAEFHHWVIVDIPRDVHAIETGTCSDGITVGGKTDPPGPAGSRQGVNDYTGWFAGDESMQGTYYGYDGPAPPWNDELVHRYHFRLFATDLERCPVEGSFTAPDTLKAIRGHVLAEAIHTGTYTLNPALATPSGE